MPRKSLLSISMSSRMNLRLLMSNIITLKIECMGSMKNQELFVAEHPVTRSTTLIRVYPSRFSTTFSFCIVL